MDPGRRRGPPVVDDETIVRVLTMPGRGRGRFADIRTPGRKRGVRAAEPPYLLTFSKAMLCQTPGGRPGRSGPGKLPDHWSQGRVGTELTPNSSARGTGDRRGGCTRPHSPDDFNQVAAPGSTGRVRGGCAEER